MDTPFTHITPPPGRWLAALVGSLVLWGISYAHAPAPVASPASPEGPNLLSAGRSRLQRWLLNDSDNAVALRQLAASPTSTALARVSQLAEPALSPRMVAANTGPNTRPAEPK